MNVITLRSTAEFSMLIAENALVMLVFHAEWCSTCREMNPVLEGIYAHNPDQIQVAKVDVDELPELAIQFDVLSLPDLYFFKDNRLVDNITGSQSHEKIQERIDRLYLQQALNYPPHRH